MKKLKLWIYSSSIHGQTRLVLVADHTVGGARGKMSTHVGVPHSKNAIPSDAEGFPAWLTSPGVWIGIVPIAPGMDDLRGLDRYSQDYAKQPPRVMPLEMDAFVAGHTVSAAMDALGTIQTSLLAERFPHKAWTVRRDG